MLFSQVFVSAPLSVKYLMSVPAVDINQTTYRGGEMNFSYCPLTLSMTRFVQRAHVITEDDVGFNLIFTTNLPLIQVKCARLLVSDPRMNINMFLGLPPHRDLKKPAIQIVFDRTIDKVCLAYSNLSTVPYSRACPTPVSSWTW